MSCAAIASSTSTATSLIAADTSSLIAYLAGESGDDVRLIESAIDARELVVPPPVATELYSKPDRSEIAALLDKMPLVVLTEGFWERAGGARRMLLTKGLKAAVADALIAQCCVDAEIALIARDRDFRHFERWCGLRLA
jgi:predicted nucleic acid-binding protein